MNGNPPLTPNPGPPATPGQAVATPDFVPATLRQKVLLAILLILTTIVVAVIWFRKYDRFQELSETPVSVNWSLPDSQMLRPADAGLRFDQEKGKLMLVGPVSGKRLEDLSKLLVSKESGDPAKPASLESYWKALNDLGFEARAKAGRERSALLLIAALSGLLGVMMRSLADCIGNACFKNTLDVRRWWPWYALRVPLGFLVGLTVVILAQSGWMNSEGQVASGAVWWLGIAMLAGYGSAEFVERLRQLSETLFGQFQQKKS